MASIDFEAASKAAERCADNLQVAQRHWASGGGWPIVYFWLKNLPDLMGNETRAEIREHQELLDRLSDGPIYRHGPIGREAFSNAHEAIVAIYDQVYFRLLLPWEGMSDADELAAECERRLARFMDPLNLDDVGIYKALIRRERAKVKEQLRQDQDSKWLSIPEAARELGFEPVGKTKRAASTKIIRLIEKGELKDNGKTGHDRKVSRESVESKKSCNR